MTDAIPVSVVFPRDLGEIRNTQLVQPEAFLTELVDPAGTGVAKLLGVDVDTWADLEKNILEKLSAASDDERRRLKPKLLSGFLPARFPEGVRKSNETCLGRQIIPHDFDHVRAGSFDEAVAWILTQLPDRFLAIHVTQRGKSADGTWGLRAFEVLDREASPAEWEARVKPHMRRVGGDGNAIDLSRISFVPVRVPLYAARVIQGPRTSLDSLVEETLPAPTEVKFRELPSEACLSKDKSAAAFLIGQNWPAPGDRDRARMALIGGLYQSGWSVESAISFIEEVHAHVPDSRGLSEPLAQQVRRLFNDSQKKYGWTELGKHIGLARVRDARNYLSGDRENFAEFQETLENIGRGSAPSAGADRDAGHFSSRINRDWNKPHIQRPFLVEGLIPRNTTSVFFAEGGSIKSWATFSLAIAVATGTPWLGRAVVKGKALILDYEDGWDEYRRRKEILLRNREGLDLTDLHHLPYGPNLVDRDLWLWLAQQDYTLVVIDALNSSMPATVDENDARFSEGLKMAGAALELSMKSTNIVVVHHANKTGGMRGSSAIRNDSDVVFKLEPVSETATKKRMRLVCDKSGPQKRPMSVNIELSDDGLCTFEDEIPQARPDAESLRDAIKLALSNAPAATKATVQARVRGTRALVYRELDELVAEGEVTLVKPGGYQLDSDERRTARVVELLRDEHFSTVSEIAKAAFVDSLFVERLLRQGVLCRSGEGRLLAVKK